MAAQTSFTRTELTAPYLGKSLLPSEPISDSQRATPKGLLTDATVASLVNSLYQNGTAPKPTGDVEIYSAKAETFISDAKKEYMYYSNRYKYSIQQLFSTVASGYNGTTTEAQTNVQQYVTIANTLNMKLNDLIQITKGVSDKMLSTSDQMKSEIEALNAKMSDSQTKLQYQSSIIKSNQVTTKINKEMMKYTEEKARYNDNLLKMYSFLNVVAIGLLIYIYRAAE